MAGRAVFLDRDGTVNVEADFLGDPALLVLERGALSGLRRLQEAGFILAIVSNQSGVARGLFSEADLRRVNAKLGRMLAAEGITIARFYYCPHHPEGSVKRYTRTCCCRKPAPGMLRAAACDLGIDLSTSYTVGDRARDLEAGRAAGTRCVLVQTGYGRDEVAVTLREQLADFVAEDLRAAASWITRDAAEGACK